MSAHVFENKYFKGGGFCSSRWIILSQRYLNISETSHLKSTNLGTLKLYQDMEKLPKTVLERIFSHLPNEDLLNVCLVCKKFNKIVSNSSDLLSRFKVLITDYENREWIGSRKYQNIHIDECRGDNLLDHQEVFDCVSDKVTEIEVRSLYQIDVDELRRFIEQFGNLRKLTLERIDEDLFENCKSLNLKELKELEFIENDVKLLKLFSKCQLEVFAISDEFGRKEALVEFLQSQKQLKILKLTYFSKTPGIFEFDEILKVKFRLKRLIINDHKISEKYQENVKNFLELHKKSLEIFEINECNFNVLNHVQHFRALKTLRIFGGSSSIKISLPKMINVETLHLESKFDNFPATFPNLKILKINTLFTNLNGINQLRYLEYLEIHNCWDFSHFHSKHIRSLKLVDCDLQNMNFHHNKLEILIVKRCCSLNWLTNFLHHDNDNLHTLKIMDVKYEQNESTQELLTAVNRINHRFRTLIMTQND